MNKPAARISALSLSILLFAGCATTSVTSVDSPLQAQAMTLLEQGKPREAAQQLEALASQQRGGARANLLADAAFAWHDAGDDARARELLAQVQPRQLTGSSRQRHQLLQAELALAAQQPAQALQALAGTTDDTVAPALAARWHLARAKALEATGDNFGAAQARSLADTALTGAPRQENQRAIVRLLAGLDDATLSSRATALPANAPLYNFAGRALIARGLPLPRPFTRDQQWQVDTSKRPPAMSDGYRPPAKLAVLLPLSGRLATAAAPVRDGLLAGYYAESRRRPEIEFFDTAGTPAGATAAYDKAIAAGADFVVGPLGRDEVDALFDREQLAVPVLALNRGKTTPPLGNAGFSLAPEDDGIIAAEFLRGRERARALVLHSNDDTGRRAAAAFKERFTERGGQVLTTLGVSDTPMNLSPQLQQHAGQADAVFLAVRAAQARALSPQLALAGLGGTTRVGSAQLTNGSGKPEEDVALDGIIYPAEAWTSRSVAGLPPASTPGDLLANARGAAGRLFAFGFDAWKIAAYTEKMAGEGGLAGATGTLYMDSNGNVLRIPAWSSFSGGRPLPVAGGN